MNNKMRLDIDQIRRRSSRWFPRAWSQISNKDLLVLDALAIVVGVCTGLGSVGFRYLIGFLQNSVLHDRWDYHLTSPIDHVRGAWMFLILPIGLLISWALTRFFAPEAKGHGVPEVIESVWRKDGVIRPRIVAIKALASSLTIASGGSVGREGPIVQIGAAIASSFGQLIRLRPTLLKTLVGCGAAGAIAATFNTPIAGVVFAIEVIILELKTKSFVPLVLSSVFATIVSRAIIGNELAFTVPAYELVSPSELSIYLALGVLSGLVGGFFIRFLYWGEDRFEELKVPDYTKPILAGLAVAGIGYYYPSVFGVGYETIADALSQESHFGLMASLVGLKMLCTTLTLAGGGSGGVFAPSLFIGAMLGGSFGYFAHLLFPDITANYGAYSLVGMAAFFSATGRATFTAIVILFEMTLDYSIILPLMFACVLSDQVSSLISKDSIYSAKLLRKGMKLASDLSVNVMSVTPVKQIMTTLLHCAKENMTMKEAKEHLSVFDHNLYPVVNEEGQLVGALQNRVLGRYGNWDENSYVKDHMTKYGPTTEANELVSVAIKKFENTRDPRVLVVDSLKSMKLVGILSPIDLVRLNSKDLENG